MARDWRRKIRFDNPDWFDHRNHPCGCETYWSLSRDRSIAIKRCSDHASHDPSYRAEAVES